MEKNEQGNEVQADREQKKPDVEKSAGDASRAKQAPPKKDGDRNRDRRNKKNHGQKDHRTNRRDVDSFHQKDDIYGDPNEERELAEWRAKIVLNATKSPSTPSPATEPINAEELAEAPLDAEQSFSVDENVTSPSTDVPAETELDEKVEIVGIRFRSAGKVYYFDPHGIKVNKGDFAIVETARGLEFGDVAIGNSMVNVKDTVTPLRPIVRVATPADVAHNEENRAKEKDAWGICQKKIADYKLEMKLIDVQYAFDNSKLLFYFSAEGRVDFRELVKDLASVFRTRIELRQIGIRDEAKMLGGIGACGRILCCSTFLPDFAQVSIKMAKEQGLSLNSAKISGMCGRLMCCLRFESDVYAEEIKRTPAYDSLVKTEDGIGTVISSNPLAGTIRVLLKDQPDAQPKQYHRDNVTVLSKERQKNTAPEEETAE